MIDCDEIRVRPSKDGSWSWTAYVGDDAVGKEDGYGGRAAAIAAARQEGGAEVLEIKRATGEVETARTSGRCRIVLQREDGSEVGELEPPPGDGNPPIQVTLAPIVSGEEATTDGQ
jgi:hypothetical protein